MPVPGRSFLVTAAVLGVAVGAGPAVGAKHRRPRLVAVKLRSHGHVPPQSAQRPPLVGTLPAGTTPTTTDPAPPPPPPSCPAAVGVVEGEYFTRPSRTKLCPGPVLVELDNTGMDDHDLKVLDTGTGTVVATWDVAHPGAKVQKHLTLAAGTYRVFCTLSDGNGAHDALGMHATITVG